MLRAQLPSTVLAGLIVAAAAGSPASAATIGHATARAETPATAAATEPVTSARSAMPYACDTSELATRIEKRTCR